MSYRRSYHATVFGHIHKSISYSYPASEHGGTGHVYVDEDVPAYIDIDIDVDTDHFDDNIEDCKREVDVLTGAVVATSAAEVAVKESTSKKIGGKIIKGFFDYVRSDISQQMMEISSKVEAVFIHLVEQKKALEAITLQMEGDYNRICSRYSKLFGDLNNELRSRIIALLQPVIGIKKEIENTLEKVDTRNQIGCVTVSSEETLRLNSILSAVSIKKRTIEIIDSINQYLTNTYKLANSVDQMLSFTDESGEIFLPVIYVESTSKSGVMVEQKSPSFVKLDPSILENSTIEYFQSDALNWSNVTEEEFEKIKFYFDMELINSGMSQRQVSLMETMLRQNTMNVLNK